MSFMDFLLTLIKLIVILVHSRSLSLPLSVFFALKVCSADSTWLSKLHF